MPFYLLLGMQAAGMIVDFLGNQHETELMNMGMKVQQAGIDANIEQTRLQAEDETVEGLKQLRQTLGTQIALSAAAGKSFAGGSGAALINESINNFNADEKNRKLNTLAKTTQLRGEGLISSLQNSADISRLWQGFGQRTLNRFSTSTRAYYKAFGGK